MELANCLVALNGDRGNTVPKYEVTPAEIAVLCAIHGLDAVFDIEPTGGDVKRSTRDELERLLRLYPAKDEDNNLVVRKVYAGASPVMHQTIEDLGLPEESFKTLERVTAKASPKKAKAKPAAEKPAPVAEVARIDNDATALFEDDAEDVTQ